MKEEIVQGLRNAIERGYSLESAAQSFVNAGYNPREVQEAMSFLSSSAIQRPNQPVQQQTPPQSNPATYTSPKKQLISPQPNLPQQNTQQYSQVPPTQLEVPPIQTDKQKRRKKILIILGIILLIIIGGVALLSFFAKSILEAIA